MSTVVEELVAKLSVEGVDRATRDLGGFSGKVEGASSKLMGIAGSLGVAAASAALMNFGDTAAELASGVSESMNKVAVVFGDSGQEVIDFSETTASAMGISQAAALETAGTFGNIFNASGVAQEAAADMSTNLVQLAADLASFNNMEPTEVLDKLRAGLVGEAEPMRALGVLLSEDAVKAKAMEMGLAATTKELTQADKVQARYALMLEQTSVAQGDFARTAEGAANTARIANAQYEDMQATIGNKVLPIKMQLLSVVGKLIGIFTSLSPAQQDIIIKIGMLAAVLGPLIAGIGLVMPVLGALGAAFGVLLGPIGLVVAAVGLLAAAWATNFGGIQEKTATVIGFVQGLIQTALGAIQGWWTEHGAQVMAAVTFLWDQVKVIFEGAFTYFRAIFNAFQSAFTGDWEGFGANLRKAWDALWKTMATLFKNITPVIQTAVVNLANGIIDRFKQINWGELGMAIVNGIVSTLKNMAGLIIKTVLSIISGVVSAVKGFFGGGASGGGESGAGAQSGKGIKLSGISSPMPVLAVNDGVVVGNNGGESGRRWVEAYRQAVQEGISGMADELAAAMEPRMDYRYRTRRMGMGALP